jgi:hypothetical protein
MNNTTKISNFSTLPLIVSVYFQGDHKKRKGRRGDEYLCASAPSWLTSKLTSERFYQLILILISVLNILKCADCTNSDKVITFRIIVPILTRIYL